MSDPTTSPAQLDGENTAPALSNPEQVGSCHVTKLRVGVEYAR